MEKKINTSNLMVFAHIIHILAIMILLSLAYATQYIFKELPCPLCFLQRAGFLMLAAALLLNLRFGMRASHYAFALLAALFTAIVALRQIALHIMPATGAYGSPIFGWHLYTWSFVIAMIFIASISMLLGINTQYGKTLKPGSRETRLSLVLIFLFVFIVSSSNFIGVVRLCGVKPCPSNPVYKSNS